MARPIWTGIISFGLLNVPVSLHSAERRTDLHFRMLDSRDNKPIRYERVNADTGEEVPWKDIVKAFEYQKGSYVVLEEEDLKAVAPTGKETVEIEAFIPIGDIAAVYFDKPYYLLPGKKAEKGYVLLREILEKTGRCGLGHVIIRSRRYLCVVLPWQDALVLNLLRFPQEVVDVGEFVLPTGKLADYRISTQEMHMAEKLVDSMAAAWTPDSYHDDYRKQLGEVVKKRLAQKGRRVVEEQAAEELPEEAATNVVDFMALLKKSIAGDHPRRSPAKAASKKTAAAAAKTPARKTPPAPRTKTASRKK